MKRTNNFTRRAAMPATLILTIICVQAARAQVASSPPYTLEQSVIAGGGGRSADAANTFSITGAIGQAITDSSSSGTYSIKSGFFNAAAPLAPTAAMVTVNGRVMTASGRGIRNAMIRMIDATGAARYVYSTTFGYYRFTDVVAGETYVFTVKGKRFEFMQPTRVLSIDQDADEINFIAAPQ